MKKIIYQILSYNAVRKRILNPSRRAFTLKTRCYINVVLAHIQVFLPRSKLWLYFKSYDVEQCYVVAQLYYNLEFKVYTWLLLTILIYLASTTPIGSGFWQLDILNQNAPASGHQYKTQNIYIYQIMNQLELNLYGPANVITTVADALASNLWQAISYRYGDLFATKV